MGKKRHSTGHTSKGERRSSIGHGGYGVTNGEKLIRKLDAIAKGKDVKITMENPNKEETNRRFITYKVKGKDYQKYMANTEKGMVNPLSVGGRS
tara:strand:- start:258 stop:539 length:282 start_codon:yes stop_codon:yes gene_type:complete